MPAWTLSGSRTWLPVAEPPPGSDSAGPNLPSAAQPVLPWSVAAPIDWSRPLLAAVVPVPSSKAYRIGHTRSRGWPLDRVRERPGRVPPAVGGREPGLDLVVAPASG